MKGTEVKDLDAVAVEVVVRGGGSCGTAVAAVVAVGAEVPSEGRAVLPGTENLTVVVMVSWDDHPVLVDLVRRMTADGTTVSDCYTDFRGWP